MPRTTLLLATGLALASVPLFAEEYEAHRRLSFDPSARGRSASFHAMIGKQVKVDGTLSRRECVLDRCRFGSHNHAM